jgi:hypothetical protein
MFGSLLIGEFGKRGQCVAPHGIDVSAQFGEIFGIEAKKVARTLPFFLHKACRFQHLEVLRDRGTADRKTAGKLANAKGPLPEQFENCLARGIRKSPEHFPSVSHTLR